MPKPYDATAKFLVNEYPLDWLSLSPYPQIHEAELIDADLSTVTASADKVLRVSFPQPWIFHVEIQANRDDRLADRVHWYNALLEYRHGLPVHSLVVLLQKDAWTSDLTGDFSRAIPGRDPYRSFRFEVIRLWERSTAEITHAGLGLLPLATLTDDAAAHLPAVLQRVHDRIEQEASDAVQADRLWATVALLMKLRYSANEVMEMVSKILQPGTAVYDMFVEWTEIKTLRSVLLRMGTQKFGVPAPTRVREAIEKTEDVPVLESWCDRIIKVSSWDDLLNGAAPDHPAP